jgi:hypothetical protein
MQLHEHAHVPLAVVAGSVEASCAAFFKARLAQRTAVWS